ncbi:hypothetical protein BHE74_00058018 [Ensete ventricosum]|nr:hypothetical protein BHE74_00058018 [Ensete ventricosum]
MGSSRWQNLHATGSDGNLLPFDNKKRAYSKQATLIPCERELSVVAWRLSALVGPWRLVSCCLALAVADAAIVLTFVVAKALASYVGSDITADSKLTGQRHHTVGSISISEDCQQSFNHR